MRVTGFRIFALAKSSGVPESWSSSDRGWLSDFFARSPRLEKFTPPLAILFTLI
jgi:hypothetical protein